MKKFFAAIILATIHVQTALGAPLWIERKFIPDSELIDPKFEQQDGTSVLTVDHSSWSDFLAAYLVVSGDGVNRVNYGAVSKDDSVSLNNYIEFLETVDPLTLSRAEQTAFWINLYNAATAKLIIENYPLDSIRDLKDPWGKPVAIISDVALTLSDIENGILRPVTQDPRIHYAVNCASIGCPNLATTPYTGETLDTMLDDAARAYVNHPRGVRVEDDDIIVSKIYGWYREDFGKKEAAMLDHIRIYANPALLEALEGRRKIKDYEYDWALNDAAISD